MRRATRWNGLTATLAGLWAEPPRLVEAVMLVLSAVMLGVWWMGSSWPPLVLYASYMTGAIASMLARECVAPSVQSTQIRLIAGLSGMAVWMGVGFTLCQSLS
jgi:hypothetical protein